MPPKLFSFTLFRKNASATPLVSDTFKTTIRPGMVVLSEHREPKDPSEPSKAFRLIHFRKNASANPLVSHTFKTKDLKSFRITHFQKKGGGYPMTTIAIPKWDSHSCLPTSGRRQHHIDRPISRSPGIKSPAVTSEGSAQPAAPQPNLFTPADVASILHQRNWLGTVESPEIAAWCDRAAALLGPHAASRDELAELLALVFHYDAGEILQQVE